MLCFQSQVLLRCSFSRPKSSWIHKKCSCGGEYLPEKKIQISFGEILPHYFAWSDVVVTSGSLPFWDESDFSRAAGDKTSSSSEPKLSSSG